MKTADITDDEEQFVDVMRERKDKMKEAAEIARVSCGAATLVVIAIFNEPWGETNILDLSVGEPVKGSLEDFYDDLAASHEEFAQGGGPDDPA